MLPNVWQIQCKTIDNNRSMGPKANAQRDDRTCRTSKDPRDLSEQPQDTSQPEETYETATFFRNRQLTDSYCPQQQHPTMWVI